MIRPESLPALNAALNGLATVLLVAAYVAVRRRNYRAHGLLMAGAFGVSCLFLAGYLTHKSLRGDQTSAIIADRELGILRTVYYVILVPHVILAAVMVPMILMLLVHAARRRWESHRRLARWTLPVWLYVSVTGVVIYAMLYHVFPAM